MPFRFGKGPGSGPNPDTKEGLRYYGWVVAVVCCALITITYGIRISFGVFFEPLEQEFGWTRALTSSIFSVYMLVGSLFTIVCGWATDRYRARTIYIITGSLAFLGLLLTSRATELWQLFVYYSFLVAMGTGPTYIIGMSTVTKWFVKRRGLAIAIVTSGVGLGSIVLVPIAAYFTAQWGWRTAYLAIGIIVIVSTIPLALLLKRNPRLATSLPKVPEPETIERAGAVRPGGKPGDFSVFEAVRTRTFLLIISMWFSYAFCLFTITTHIVRHGIDLGIDPVQAASVVSVSGFANIPVRITMGLISDRFGKKKAILFCTSLMLFSMVWLTQSTSLWMLYVFAIAFGAAYGGLAPPTSALIGDSFGTRNIGAIFGALEIGWVAGGAAGPALAGYIFDATGSYHLAFWLLALATLSMVVLASFLKAAPYDPSNRQPA